MIESSGPVLDNTDLKDGKPFNQEAVLRARVHSEALKSAEVKKEIAHNEPPTGRESESEAQMKELQAMLEGPSPFVPGDQEAPTPLPDDPSTTFKDTKEKTFFRKILRFLGIHK